MSEHGGADRKFSIERVKAPTRADEKAIRDLHSALHPHSMLERILLGLGHDESLYELEKMDGVFVARDEAGKPHAALTVAHDESGWQIHHLQSDLHDPAVLSDLFDKALAFAKERGAREIAVRVSERSGDVIAALREKDFQEVETGETRVYRRYL